MTEPELEILRLKLSLEVHRVLLRGLYTMLANTSPAAAQAQRDRFAELRASHATIAIPCLPLQSFPSLLNPGMLGAKVGLGIGSNIVVNLYQDLQSATDAVFWMNRERRGLDDRGHQGDKLCRLWAKHAREVAVSFGHSRLSPIYRIP